jgi:ubiquinone/menaquinone biosynthesis C-methylase UbiE
MKGYSLGNTAKNEQSRHKKATKIIRLISERKPLKGTTVLDIGTGAGYIAHELSKYAKEVHSTDIVDDRKIKAGYKQEIVKDETLPYKDKTFDVVISNHVLEHVPNQAKHFAEIRRVLKDDGVAYLASPNKWWLTDPHYHLPFISWLPRPVANQYLRIAKGRKWDIYSLSLKSIHRHAAKHNLSVADESWKVIVNPKDYGITLSDSTAAILKRVPKTIVGGLLHVMPTHLKTLTVEDTATDG